MVVVPCWVLSRVGNRVQNFKCVDGGNASLGYQGLGDRCQ